MVKHFVGGLPRRLPAVGFLALQRAIILVMILFTMSMVAHVRAKTSYVLNCVEKHRDAFWGLFTVWPVGVDVAVSDFYVVRAPLVLAAAILIMMMIPGLILGLKNLLLKRCRGKRR